VSASIIIPVFNGAGLTRLCVERILAEPPNVNHEIIVVDDASTDGSTDRLSRDFSGDRVHLVRRERNGGFAAACNQGAQGARGEHLVFLNNDTIPLSGWLDALVAYAERHPQAAVVGSKLLFPDETIQHAGVVFCQDGQARHLYAGLDADLPFVERSRRFQAVTAACTLVREDVFREVGGFDEAYRNGMEDADLCLRVGEMGHEVHYCHESVLYHLESVSRGRTGPEIKEGIRRFRERWGGTVRRDDVDYYVADGLLRFEYQDGFPLRLGVSPLLATLDLKGRPGEVERLMEDRSRHVVDLLRDVVELTARLADLADDPGPEVSRTGTSHTPPAQVADPKWLSDRFREIELEIHDLQLALVGGQGEGGRIDRSRSGLPTSHLARRDLVRRLRILVEETIPLGATVAIVSRGDDSMLDLGERRSWHFPRSEDGRYAGHHPADGDEAVAHLESLRGQGAEYLVVPEPSRWWLDYYDTFAFHLSSVGRPLADCDAGVVFSLSQDGVRPDGPTVPDPDVARRVSTSNLTSR
jgi:GT2 family glycosyltransferase